MRKSIIALGAALVLASGSALATGNHGVRIITHNTNSFGGGVLQGTSANATSVSGAASTGNGYAVTGGVSNMQATSASKLVTGPSIAIVGGRTAVSGHTASETLVLGSAAAGTLATGDAKSGVIGGAGFESGSHNHICGRFGCSPGFNYQTTQAGEASILAKSKGGATSATGSIGTGGGLSVNGFAAHGNAKALADVDVYRGGNVATTDANVWTSSGAESYSLNLGNATGGAGALGIGTGHADSWRVNTD